MDLVIGVDFDNTIVCYDTVFHAAAVEKKLIDLHFPKNKEKIRDHLRKSNKEPEWTELQGFVYGKKMECAEPFPGVIDFFKLALARDIEIRIISHKTRYPYAGPAYDLHEAAYQWLVTQQFFSNDHIGLDESHVYFLETKSNKCKKIGETGCTHFIDDLPEILLDDVFPRNTKKLLFSPENTDISPCSSMMKFTSWDQIKRHFFYCALQ